MTNQIVVNGSTPRKRALAREIVEYCIKELMPRTTTLDISVNICKIEDDFISKNNLYHELYIMLYILKILLHAPI